MSIARKWLWKSGGLAVILTACLAWQTAHATAATFSFASVRDTNSLGYTQFVGGPTINNQGVVAFIGVQAGQARVETSGGTFGMNVDLDQQTVSSPTVANGATNPRVAFQWTTNRGNGCL